MSRLLTPKQAVEEFNLPSVRTIRTLRAQGLPTVKLGAARLIDYDDMVDFIAARKASECQGVTGAPGSNGLKGVKHITLYGMSAGKSGSVLLAQQTAEKLKRASRRSSDNTSDRSPGRVLPMK